MDQLFAQFGLNLHLLLGQMMNFGIIVLLLYKFVYRPIIKILDERKTKIENSLNEAKKIEERSKHLGEEIEARINEGKKQAEHIITEAKAIGEKLRNDILMRTNKEVLDMVMKTKEEAAREKEVMMQEVKEYILKTSFLIIEKLLAERLDKKIKEQLIADTFKEISTVKQN